MIFGAGDVGEDNVIYAFFTNPIATPATGAFNGTPASISESDAPQMVAIDDDPFDSICRRRRAWHKANRPSWEARRKQRAPQVRHADFARPAPRIKPTSPTEKGGKL